MHYDVNFDLRIETKKNNCYKVTLFPPNVGESCLCEDILSEQMLSDIARLEQSFIEDDPSTAGRSSGKRKYEPVDGKFLKAFGEKLFECLFRGSIRDAFHENYGSVRGNDEAGLRIRLMVDAPEIAALPWELMFTKHRFLSTWDKVSVTRYLNRFPKYEQFEIQPPVRVLVAIPEGSDLEVAKEQKIVCEAFKNLSDEGLVKLNFLEGCVSVESIRKGLDKGEKFHVFHFIGHGCFSEDNDQEGYLRLNLDPGAAPLTNDRRGELEKEGWLRADSFADLFMNHPSMKLVVLNACQGARLSKTKPLAGLAPHLFSRDIPAVVAMQYPIFDDSAITFSREFYRKLCDRRDFGLLDVAVSNARNVIHGQRREDPDFVTPVLFMNSGSGAAFDLDDGIPEKATTVTPPFKSVFQKLGQKLSAPFVLLGDQPRLKAVSVAREENLSVLRQEEDAAIEPEERDRLAQMIATEETKLARVQQRLADAAGISLRVARLMIVISLITFIAAIFGLFNLVGIDDLLQQKAASLRGADSRAFGNGLIRLIAVDPTQQVNGFPNREDGKEDRRQHARLIDALADAKAKVVVLDVYYEEDPKTTDKGTSKWDNELASAITRASDKGTQVIVGVNGVNENGTPKARFPELLAQPLQSRWGNVNVGLEYELGPIKLANGIEGFRTVVRYVELGKEKSAEPGRTIPQGAVPVSSSLMLETLRNLKAETPALIPEAYFYPNEKQIKLLGHEGRALLEIPVLDDEMSFMFEPAKEEALKPFRSTFQDVYRRLNDGGLPKENYEGKIVLIGYEEPVDLHNVAGGREMYGVDIHASVLSNIFQHVYIKKLRWELNLLITFIMALIGYLLQTDRGRRLTLKVPLDTRVMRKTLRIPLPLIVVTLVYFAVMYVVYTTTSYFIDMTYHIAALFISYWVAGVPRKARTTSLPIPAKPTERRDTLVEI